MPMRKIFTLQFFINFTKPDQTISHHSEGNEFIEEPVSSVPDYCIENIMNFARSYRVADSKSTGKIEMILN